MNALPLNPTLSQLPYVPPMQIVVAASVPFVAHTCRVSCRRLRPRSPNVLVASTAANSPPLLLSGGVPHPSGYPTYMLLARCALWLMPGEPAYALAVLSAISMAVAAACTSLFVLHLAPVSARSSFHTVAPAVYCSAAIWPESTLLVASDHRRSLCGVPGFFCRCLFAGAGVAQVW